MNTKNPNEAPAKRVNPEFEMVSEGCPNHQGLDDIPLFIFDDSAATDNNDDSA